MSSTHRLVLVGEDAGGIWAFTPVTSECSSSARTVLGVQPSNRTFTPGAFQLRVENATGAALDEVRVRYTFAFLNDAPRSMVHTLAALSVDASGDEVDRVDVTSLRFVTPVAASGAPVWEGECIDVRIDVSSLAIADGDHRVAR